MSRAMIVRAGIGGSGVWWISRGLARGLRGRQEYKMAMNVADSPRSGDLDGRGIFLGLPSSSFLVHERLDQIRFNPAEFLPGPVATAGCLDEITFELLKPLGVVREERF